MLTMLILSIFRKQLMKRQQCFSCAFRNYTVWNRVWHLSHNHACLSASGKGIRCYIYRRIFFAVLCSNQHFTSYYRKIIWPVRTEYLHGFRIDACFSWISHYSFSGFYRNTFYAYDRQSGAGCFLSCFHDFSERNRWRILQGDNFGSLLSVLGHRHVLWTTCFVSDFQLQRVYYLSYCLRFAVYNCRCCNGHQN